MGKEKHVKAHSKGLLKGTLFGVIVGGIAALLLAPKSGKETQKALKSKAKKAVKTADVQLIDVESKLEGRIDSLKVAARDLRGEAYEESQRLLTKAQLLKTDLQASAQRLSKTADGTKENAKVDAKRLVSEGQAVLSELEAATKRIMNSAKTKAREQADGDTDTK